LDYSRFSATSQLGFKKNLVLRIQIQKRLRYYGD
jgi:hypothetical protein